MLSVVSQSRSEEEDKLKTRAQGAIEGLFLGAGINLGFSWVQRTAGVWWKKQRALKKVVKASQGKGDATVALKELDKAIKEEDALKNDITSEVNITDERLEPQKTTDELLAEADEAVERIKEPVKKKNHLLLVNLLNLLLNQKKNHVILS